MNRTGLVAVKAVVIFVVLIFIVISKKLGVPILIANMIGLAVVFAVWKYKPEEPGNSDKHELDKK